MFAHATTLDDVFFLLSGVNFCFLLKSATRGGNKGCTYNVNLTNLNKKKKIIQIKERNTVRKKQKQKTKVKLSISVFFFS
jgi:hypothetical protein